MSNPNAGPNGIKTQWAKGVSRNPGGRPKGYSTFRKALRKHTPEAINALLEALKCEGERVGAAKALLEFTWGRAPSAETLQAMLESEKRQASGEVREEMLEALSDGLADSEATKPH